MASYVKVGGWKLADDKFLIIKKADKKSAAVVWDCNGNILKA